jgi:hypothetical protein
MDSDMEKAMVRWWQFSFWLSIKHPNEFHRYYEEYEKNMKRLEGADE